MQTPPEDFGALLKESAQSARDSGSFDMHAEFGDIKPLKQDRLIIRTPLLDKATAKVRQDNATRDKEQEALDEASSAFVHMVDPNDVLSFRRDGVQPYMLRKLKNGEYLDFCARRLVEMAGHILMGHLLVLDASRDDMFARSAAVYLNHGEAEVRKHAAFLEHIRPEDVELYKA